MSFIAPDPESYAGQVVDDGQCVAFIKEASGAPQTSLWREGIKVRGATIPQVRLSRPSSMGSTQPHARQSRRHLYRAK